MLPGTESHPELDRLARAQLGVLRRRQFDHVGVHRSHVRNQLAARRWMPVGPHVVILQNTPPTRTQMMWAAVLDADVPAAMCSHTALELAGLTPFAREASYIHLIVPRGATPTRFPGVVVHESRRLAPERWLSGDGLARTETPRSVIDAGAWQPWPRFACLMIATAVQQRVCTPEQIEEALGYVGRVRHKAYMRVAVRDVASGAESLGEIDVARMCERFGIAAPMRQRRRSDSRGRNRYLDCEWDLASGECVVLEIDGSHHVDVANWQEDMRRERSIVSTRRWVLRATAFEVRLEPQLVVEDLIRMGVPRVVSRSAPILVLSG